MGLRSQIYERDLDILSSTISMELEEQNVILVRYEGSALKQLIDVVADPETGNTNMGQVRFAELCKKTALEMGFEKAKFSQKTISNYINEVYMPDNDNMEVMGKVLGVSFVSDWGKVINNQDVIDRLKALYHR